MSKCQYVCDYYKVPADINREVAYEGQKGIIVEDRGNYIGVNFFNEKPTIVHSIHPTDEKLEYLTMGKPRKLTRSQQRYQEFLRQDWFEGTFAEWLGVR